MTMNPSRFSPTGVVVALLVAACTLSKSSHDENDGDDESGRGGESGEGGTGGRGGAKSGGASGTSSAGTSASGSSAGGIAGRASDVGGDAGASAGEGGSPEGGDGSGGTTGSGGGAGTTGGDAGATGGDGGTTGGSAGTTGGSAGTTGGSAGTTGGSAGTTGGGAGTTGGGAGTTGGGAGSGAGGGGTGGSAGGGSTGVTVELNQTKQTIEGFGINNTYATESFSSSVADHLFTTTGNGLGLSILRIGMGSNGGYATPSVSGDTEMARSRGAKIIGTTWSPPANCKTNNSEYDGGHVLAACYEQWANTIASFAQANALYAMSIASEPDFASCGSAEPCNGSYPTTVYTASELSAFIKVAGPKLHAVGVKVIAPEAAEWIHTFSNESACCSEPNNRQSSDPLNCGFPATNCAPGQGYDYGHHLYADQAAWAALDIMGVHEYDTQRAEPWPADIPDRKPVWQTEMSGIKWWPEQGPSTTIENGIAVAGWIHSALVVGDASAWLWWWYKAYNTDDNEGLLLKNGQDTKRHWTFGNYSKFVRPGYVRVDVTGAAPAEILLSAYKGSGGKVVIVAINQGAAAATVPITIAGGTAPTTMTPWVTSTTDNLVSKTAVAVSGGILTATLASKTVTTYVSP